MERSTCSKLEQNVDMSCSTVPRSEEAAKVASGVLFVKGGYQSFVTCVLLTGNSTTFIATNWCMLRGMVHKKKAVT